MGLVKTKPEIEIMRQAGSLLASIMRELEAEVIPGISTAEINSKAESLCAKHNVRPAFKGYNGFPAVICTGIDDIAVHGIPSKAETLQEGMIISIDMGIELNGYYADHAVTVPVGNVDDQARKLLKVTKFALESAIDKAADGNYVGDISHTIQSVAELSGFQPIRQMTGHGIGSKLHEPPEIPCFGEPGTGMKLRAGMTIAIEPMINEGSWQLTFSEDGWTTRTLDGSRSAIFEHTILVGEKKGEILTE